MESKLTINLEKIAVFVNRLLPMLTGVVFLLGLKTSFYFHFLTVPFLLITVLNLYYLYGQKRHVLLAQDVFPDYIDLDGAEGGTGAAPKSFMDDMGTPLFKALCDVQAMLSELGIRERVHVVCSGKLISAGKQFMAMALGADARYSARGFMLALGCIQALQCNKNTCPVGITTHELGLQRGLDIEQKSHRVANYVAQLDHDHYELLAALGALLSVMIMIGALIAHATVIGFSPLFVLWIVEFMCAVVVLGVRRRQVPFKLD